jgi:hypothetical protein
MAPIANKVKIQQQGDSDFIRNIENEMINMEQSGVFSDLKNVDEMRMASDYNKQVDFGHQKATEGSEGGKITLDDMMFNRPRKQLISRKIENDIDDYPKET